MKSKRAVADTAIARTQTDRGVVRSVVGRAATPAATTVALCALLCGCGGVGGGPLPMGGDSGALCVAAQADEPYVIGEVVTPTDDVVIDRVELTGIRGLDEVGPPVVVSLSAGEAAIGALRLAYVETSYQETWAARRDARGATLEKDSTYSVLVVLSSTEQSGSADAMKVFYRSGGRDYTAAGTTRYTFRAHC